MSFVTFLNPSRAGDSTGWTPSIGTANWTLMADDDDATTVQAPALNALDLYYLSPLPSVAYNMAAAPGYPLLDFWFNAPATSQVAPVWKLGGVTVVGTPVVGNGAWQAIADHPARPGGGAWHVGDFSVLQAGFKCTTLGGGDVVLVRKLNVQVNYVDRSAFAMVADNTGMNSATYPPRDPVPVQLDVTMSAANIATVDVYGSVTFGPITIPGQVYPVYVSLSRDPLVNLGEGL